jgi:adenosylcobinamide-GDP ribazoletransferase
VSGLLGAIQFLTRIPVRSAAPATPDRTVPWIPVVGGMIGLVVGLAAGGLAELVPVTVAAAVAVLFGVLLTGAFHEDGLADVADAFAGGWSPDERMGILKDPLHGTYGVAALTGSIVVRIASLATMTPAAAVGGAVAAHALGRAAAVGAMVAVRPAAADGLGADAANAVDRGRAVVGVAGGVTIAALATGWWVGPLVAAAAAAGVAVAALAVRKIGGITGDVLGAVEQVVECTVLVVVTGLASRHQIWWR